MSDVNQNADEDQLQTLHYLTKQLLKDISLSNATYTIEVGSTKGDGYLSRIYRIKITTKEGREKYYIAKIAHTDPEIRKLMTIRVFFEAEIHFYDDVFPIFREFQQTRNVLKFDHVAKCYLTHLIDQQETLIFDDLKQRGFDMWNRKLPMPKGHIVEVLRLYGKYHAISFALRDQEPQVFQKLAEGTVDGFKICARNYTQKIKDSFLEHLMCHQKYLEEKAPEKAANNYKQIAENWEEIIEGVEDKEGQQSVFIHGDSWCNNVMFKVLTYFTQTQPTSKPR